jgi:hypothetical protein
MTETATSSTKPAPDRPPVPRARKSFWTKVVIGFAVIVLGGYTAVAVTQRELRDVEKDEIPGSVRSSPGGYRSYSFWHSGYHGGK